MSVIECESVFSSVRLMLLMSPCRVMSSLLSFGVVCFFFVNFSIPTELDRVLNLPRNKIPRVVYLHIRYNIIDYWKKGLAVTRHDAQEMSGVERNLGTTNPLLSLQMN
jgi:hypothetical protein